MTGDTFLVEKYTNKNHLPFAFIRLTKYWSQNNLEPNQNTENWTTTKNLFNQCSSFIVNLLKYWMKCSEGGECCLW